jgi:DIS3-like exonuclease 1
MPLVLISDDPKSVERYGNMTVGVLVMSMDEYLNNFWPEFIEARELYDSISSSLTELKVSRGPRTICLVGSSRAKEYQDHLPLDMLAVGIKSGTLIQGCLQVSKYKPTEEAYIEYNETSTSDISTAIKSGILIPGLKHRCRAVHGDIVAVELLPQSQWGTKSNALVDYERLVDDVSSETSNTEKRVPSGRVVGILQRNWRDYVASLADDEEVSQSKSVGRVSLRSTTI